MVHETSSSRTTPGLTRTIVDPSGRVWFVREMKGESYDRRAAGSLVFVTDDVMRRIRNYPADWPSLSDDALYGLSLRR